MKGNEEIKIKVAGKKFVVSRWFYSDIVNMFYDKEIEGLSIKDGRIVIKTKAQEIKVNNDILHEGFRPLYSIIKRGWKYENGIIEKSDGSVKFKYTSYSVLEVFEENVYGNTNVSNKEVIDIGANVGDSSIYFALKGAKKVIGVEPLPNVYTQAIENVKLNHLEDKVFLINAAIGSKRGKLKVPCNMSTPISNGFSTLKSNGDCEVPIVTLSEVMKQLTEPYLLKMDCEGCEFDVILNDYEHVRMFEKLIIEHHAKFTGIEYTKLLDKLSKDFHCELTSTVPWISKEEVGLLWCDKIK
ncbi:SAM-dependent methyltransferase [Sulfolobus islandicus LAL14/1]|uniref:SAM-dependent methyltransferase n=2 Tax=Saccharolobus islandicus TaxID=43080 RepID=M9U5H3_SACIS|nr:SAM-dependent methyltransferase [Sulfolobus islandicus LAL14/1]